MPLIFAWYGSYWGLDWYETGITMGHTSLISSFVLSVFYTRPSLMIQNQEQHIQFALCFSGRISNQEFKRDLKGSWSDLGIVVVADN
jgi:hypothetical protein